MERFFFLLRGSCCLEIRRKEREGGQGRRRQIEGNWRRRWRKQALHAFLKPLGFEIIIDKHVVVKNHAEITHTSTQQVVTSYTATHSTIPQPERWVQGSNQRGGLGGLHIPLGVLCARGMHSTLLLLWTPQKWHLSFGRFVSFCSKFTPTTAGTQLFLVLYNFFVFCCSRRYLSRCNHCSKRSQLQVQPVSMPNKTLGKLQFLLYSDIYICYVSVIWKPEHFIKGIMLLLLQCFLM